MKRCENCKGPISPKEMLCWECQWEHAKAESTSDSQPPIKTPFPSDAQLSLDQANAKLKKNLTVFGVVALAGISFVAMGVQISTGGTSELDANGSRSSDEQATTARITTQAVYFDKRHVPLFVGKTVNSSVELLRDEFDEYFDEIRNIDSGEKISTHARRDSDLEKFAGLYVCSQSIAPGSDPRDLAFGNIDLEVSKSCANVEPNFAMGPAAELLGRYVPRGFGGDCASIKYCEVEEIDGVIVGFEEDGYRSHKTALVQTGLGTHEIELAMIDLSSIWCGVNSESSGDLETDAIAERDRLLPVGTLVRLRGGAYLSDGERMLHRLNQDGTYKDGDPVTGSANELLVATGSWVPSEYIAEHPWERVSYFREELLEPVWVMLDRSIDSEEESEYRMRIVDAANATFATPAGQLVACIEEKDEAVAVLIANEEEEERNRRATFTSDKSNRSDGVWTTDDCDGDGYYEHPQLCDGGDRLIREALAGGGTGNIGGGSGSSVGSSGGSNCTWVNSYTRKDGTRVRGHTRCR